MNECVNMGVHTVPFYGPVTSPSSVPLVLQHAKPSIRINNLFTFSLMELHHIALYDKICHM